MPPDILLPSGEPATRFFARIISLDLACPGCGTVHRLRQGLRGRSEGSSEARVWNRKTQRFRCDKCKLALALGVIASRPPKGPATPAWDQIPTRREAQELRNQAVSGWVEGERGVRGNREPE